MNGWRDRRSLSKACTVDIADGYWRSSRCLEVAAYRSVIVLAVLWGVHALVDPRKKVEVNRYRLVAEPVPGNGGPSVYPSRTPGRASPSRRQPATRPSIARSLIHLYVFASPRIARKDRSSTLMLAPPLVAAQVILPAGILVVYPWKRIRRRIPGPLGTLRHLAPCRPPAGAPSSFNRPIPAPRRHLK